MEKGHLFGNGIDVRNNEDEEEKRLFIYPNSLRL